MSGIATAIVGGAAIGAIGSGIAADKGAKATEKAAGISADAQMQQLEYLKEVDKVPKAYREAALAEFGNLYGVGATPVSFDEKGNPLDAQGNIITKTNQQLQQESFAGLENNPLYQAIMGSQEAGEDAILRRAGATGGLRSGNVQSALAEHATDLKNKALITAYQDQLQGLRGLANLPGQTENIAQVMGNIGDTQAQGMIAQGQIWQGGIEGITNAVGTGVGNFLYAKGKGII